MATHLTKDTSSVQSWSFSEDIKTSADTASVSEFLRVDPSGGSFLVTGAQNPRSTSSGLLFNGEAFGVVNVTTDATSITVDGNGADIEDPAALGSFSSGTITASGAGFRHAWAWDPNGSAGTVGRWVLLP